MNTLSRKIIVLAIAATMVFAVAVLGGCGVSALQSGLNALQADIVYLYENGGMLSQLDEKQERIDAFRNGANGTLNAAQKRQLHEMQRKVDYMRNGVCDCELKEFFDLTDPKDIWDGNVNEHSPFNSIFVIFRRIRDGKPYPILELRHFNLPTAVYFVYLVSETPPTWSGNPELGEFFRQSGFIHLAESRPQTLSSAIRHLESLCFVQSVHPLRMHTIA